MEHSPFINGSSSSLTELLIQSKKHRRNHIFCQIGTSLIIVAIITILTHIFLPNCPIYPSSSYFNKNGELQYKILETIPIGMNVPLKNTYHLGPEVVDLCLSAKKTFHVAAFYITLSMDDTPLQYGKQLYDCFVEHAHAGRLKLVVDSNPSDLQKVDIMALKEMGAELNYLDMSIVNKGIGGRLHTKFMIADKTALYIGSANIDYRSLTHVKELGIVVFDSTMASDLLDVWRSYKVGSSNPIELPRIASFINVNHRYSNSSAYISSGPRVLAPRARSNDLDAILHAINRAKEFVNIAVMDYFPGFQFLSGQPYWAVLDDALRRAAYRGVNVSLLFSCWPHHTRDDQWPHYLSLNDVDGIAVRIYTVPQLVDQPAFSRVQHTKYLVSDGDSMVHTSNWSADYFIDTAGVSFVSDDAAIRGIMKGVFERDFYGEYSSADVDWMQTHCFSIGPQSA
ncbi:hypothetical protein PCE1_000114 [Barthelona sp. PCE]